MQGSTGLCLSRWGKEYCEEIGLGYAPGGQYLIGKHHYPKQLQKLGLINQHDQDFFFKHLIIPIRDRYYRIIGFTARRLDGESKAKYINSKDSPIYKKGESLFGIDSAMTSRASRDIFLKAGLMKCACRCLESAIP